MGKTLFDKVWDSHVVKKIEDGPDVLFIDRHMVHEVTSPVAFLGLKNRNINLENKIQLKKLELIKDSQLRTGGLIFALIGFIIIYYAKS